MVNSPRLTAKNNGWLWPLLVALIVLCTDQLTKYFFLRTQYQTSGHLVDITVIFNKGTLWGFFHNAAYSNIFFIIFSLVLLTTLALLLYRSCDFSLYTLRFPLLLLYAGALGNIIDRILHGAVVDWINLHFWPIFNIADAAIVVSVIWLLVIVWRTTSSNTARAIK